MPRVRSGIRARPAGAMSALVVVTSGLLAWVLVRQDVSQLEGMAATRGQEVADYLARNAERSVLSGDGDGLRELGQQAAERDRVVYSRFFDRHGAPLVAVGLSSAPPGGDGSAPGPRTREFRASVTTVHEHERSDQRPSADGTISPAARDVERIGRVAVGVSLAGLEEVERELVVTATGVTVLLALAGAVCAALIARLTLAPQDPPEAEGAVGSPVRAA